MCLLSEYAVFSVRRCARSLLVSALCAVATGCGSSTTNCWQVTLLHDGRSEWGSEHGDVILVPRGLSVTREIRLTNRTGSILQKLRARTGCPTCSSARIKAEDLPNGESSVLAVTVALAGPSFEGDRKVRVFMSADRVGAAEPQSWTLDFFARDIENRVFDLIDRPAFFEASWKEARELRLHPQVWVGIDVDPEVLRISSQQPALTFSKLDHAENDRVLELVVELNQLPVGAVNTSLRVTAPRVMNGDDISLVIPIRGWIKPRYVSAPPFIHLGAMPLEDASRTRRVLSISEDVAEGRESAPVVESLHGTWTVGAVYPDGSNGWLVEVCPAPTRCGECIDTLRVGNDSRDSVDIRAEVNVEGIQTRPNDDKR